MKSALISGSHGQFNDNVHVVLAGLTNTYSQYITTFEEYEVQRYEVSPISLRFFLYIFCPHVTKVA